MARTSAKSLLAAVGTNAELAELYGAVIEGVQKETISAGLKSQAYTGDPRTGSVEFKRFANATVANYGAARTAHKGDEVIAAPVTVNLDQRKEIVEEVSKHDLDTFGVEAIMARRALGHLDSMAAELENAFFTQANTDANAVTTNAETDLERLEDAILSLETVSNDYVRGVPRSAINVICSPAFFSKVRNKLDTLPAVNVDTAAEEFGSYRGVRVYSSNYIPEGTDAIIMADGAVALPVFADQYSEPEKVPLSNDFAVSLFFTYGKKTLASDLVFKLTAVPVALEELDVTSQVGTDTAGDTFLTIDPASAGSGNKYVYKLGKTYASFKYDDTLTTGWTDYTDASTAIAAGDNTKATVAKVVAATGKARGRGIAVLAKKA